MSVDFDFTTPQSPPAGDAADFAFGPSSAGVDIDVTGVFATGAVGTVSVADSTEVPGTGVFATGAVGEVEVVGNAAVYPLGVSAIAHAGYGLVWSAVDDIQTTDWHNINDLQDPGWTPVIDAQTPGWAPVP